MTLLWLTCNHLTGLVVKVSASRAEDPGFKSHVWQDISRSSHTSDLKTGTPAATLPAAWCYRVSGGTGWPAVSILWLGGVETLICNFFPSVAAWKLIWTDPSPRYTSMLLWRWATNKQQSMTHLKVTWSGEVSFAGLSLCYLFSMLQVCPCVTYIACYMSVLVLPI